MALVESFPSHTINSHVNKIFLSCIYLCVPWKMKISIQWLVLLSKIVRIQVRLWTSKPQLQSIFASQKYKSVEK